eukprot:gene28685-34631_t
MDELNAKLEGIRSLIRSFRAEQEKIILKVGEQSTGSKAVVNKIVPPAVDSSKGNADENQLTQILDVDAVVMPVLASFGVDQRIWPQALSAKHKKNAVTLDNIENHGTLWRLIHKPDVHPGCRVYLKSAELGEEPRYLSAALTLVQDKADAALWNLRPCRPPRDTKAVQFTDTAATKGVYVSLELLDASLLSQLPYLTGLADTYTPQSPHDFASFPRLLPHTSSSTTAAQAAHSMLTCTYTQLGTETELVLTSTAYMKEQREKDELREFCLIWEVCPEAWISEDMDFLDRFLS